MIRRLDDGTYVISAYGVWVAGVYEDARTARWAFRFSEETLDRLQRQANRRAGGTGGTITWGDLAREKPRSALAK